METMTLKATNRTLKGRKTNRLRAAGQTPAVVYGPGVPSRSIAVPTSEFLRVYRSAGESTLVDLEVEGTPVKVLVQDVARDAVTDLPLHVDFQQVAMDKSIAATIPLRFVGIALAAKAAGAVLVKQFDEVDVSALPSALVHDIEVDLGILATADDVIRVKDIVVPEGITLDHDPDAIVASISEVTEEEEAPVAVPTATPEATSAPAAPPEGSEAKAPKKE